jgi:hypothetical protein
MTKEIETAYSAEEIRKLLRGPDDEIVHTIQVSTFQPNGSLNPINYDMTRGELRDVISRISSDHAAIKRICSEARRVADLIDSGRDPRAESYPHFSEILSCLATDDWSRRCCCPLNTGQGLLV